MKFFFFLLTLFSCASSLVHAQSNGGGNSAYHSNLGIQEIVEIGSPYRVGRIASPTFEIPVRPAKPASPSIPGGETPSVPASLPESDSSPSTEIPGSPTPSGSYALPFDISFTGGLRLYRTDNVLRTKSGEQDSGVLESSLGFGLTGKEFSLGEYVTMIPRLDLFVQWANYGEDTVKDLLDYRFGLLKGSLGFSLPMDWTLTTALDYNHLANQESGDRMFDAVSPSIGLQKAVSFTDQSFLLIDLSLKRSYTDKVIPFSAPGIFADDGDNWQYGVSLSYAHLFGPDNRWIVMPNFSVIRSSYLKNTHDGRVDYLTTFGLMGIYQWREWLGFQAFANYSTMSTNSLGDTLLGQSSSSNTLDLGIAVTGTYRF